MPDNHELDEIGFCAIMVPNSRIGVFTMKLPKKYIYYLLVIFIVLLIILPLIINFLFKNDAICSLFEAEWHADSALTYCGSIISGIGTVFLGAITIYQTNQIYKNSQEQNSANTKRPFFAIKKVGFQNNEGGKWSLIASGYTGTYDKQKYAFIEVANIGDGIANNLMFEHWGFGEIPRENRPCFCIPLQGGCNIPILLQISNVPEFTQYVDLVYENIVGYAYVQRLELHIEHQPAKSETECDSYRATLYNIHPQIPLGQNKFDHATGKYNIDFSSL